ncbi:MAG: ParB/RepB/Spo0J family partition protein [Methylacidiphilales bacterium]|nr:ParB/RepB/Spo0J family partition protein [Candidatus Methylacidiphilales bacterium]
MKEEVKLIPIENIRILNPRHRDQKKFQAIVQSIKNLGLKKPIKVSLRTAGEGNEPGYDLVAGQGRIEACLALGFKEIAAIVVSISKGDRLLMSLAENMARRFPAPMDMVAEIQRLKGEGYTNVVIGEKLDIDHTVVGGLLTLMKSGEERLVEAAMQNKIPIGVAIDIAKTEGADAQKELLKAYEAGQLNQFSIRTLRRLLEQRRVLGKKPCRGGKRVLRTTADGFVSAYQREIQRQKAFIRKARVFDSKLALLVSAFRQLMQDENFTNLLKAEGLLTMPKYLAEKAAAT